MIACSDSSDGYEFADEVENRSRSQEANFSEPQKRDATQDTERPSSTQPNAVRTGYADTETF